MKTTFINQQYEDQIVDQYLSGDTACRVFATLEYYTYRSIQKPVPGIFAKYNGKNNSGITKSLEQLKRQLKTHVLSFLASHQDMINVYGSYPFPNNFKEKDVKAFINNCEKQIKDPEVKIYCNHLISILKKDYQTVLNYYKNMQKKNRPEMDPKTQISKYMPAIGYSYQNEEKATKLAREGKYTHTIDINELAKRKMLIQSSFMNCIDSLSHYSNGLILEDEIHKELEEFLQCFKENENFFEYPQGYNDKTTKTMISHIARRSENAKFYCMVFSSILTRQYDSASKMLLC